MYVCTTRSCRREHVIWETQQLEEFGKCQAKCIILWNLKHYPTDINHKLLNRTIPRDGNDNFEAFLDLRMIVHDDIDIDHPHHLGGGYDDDGDELMMMVTTMMLIADDGEDDDDGGDERKRWCRLKEERLAYNARSSFRRLEIWRRNSSVTRS